MTESDPPSERGSGDSSLIPGTVFAGRFEIIGHLGHGGMSTVFKARHTQMDRVVALKLLRGSLFTDGSKAAERMRREAQAVSALDHPSIVRVLSFGLDAGNEPYLVMEFVEGETLSEVLAREKQMPVQLAVAITVQLANALACAHSHGIIHRDIKPGNIMIVSDSRADSEFAFGPSNDHVQLLDFGLAKSIVEDETAQRLTRTDCLVGTSYYMSPEQCQRGQLDARSDIYSLGCVLYEMLAGTPPVAGDSNFAIMYSHLHDTIPPLPASVPPWLVAIVMRMIARAPDDRFESMDEVVASLRTQAPPAVHKRRRAKSGSKMTPATVLTALLGMFAACLIAGSMISKQPRSDAGVGQAVAIAEIRNLYKRGYHCDDPSREYELMREARAKMANYLARYKADSDSRLLEIQILADLYPHSSVRKDGDKINILKTWAQDAQFLEDKRMQRAFPLYELARDPELSKAEREKYVRELVPELFRATPHDVPGKRELIRACEHAYTSLFISDPPTSRRCINRTLEVIAEIDGYPPFERAKHERFLGEWENSYGDKNKAKTLLTKVAKIAENESETESREAPEIAEQALAGLRGIAFLRGNASDYVDTTSRLMAQNERHPDRKQKDKDVRRASLALDKARWLVMLGKIPLAEQATKIADTRKDDPAVAPQYMNVRALIAQAKGNMQGCKEWFLKAHAKEKELHDMSWQTPLTLDQLGLLYFREGQHEKGIQFIQEAISMVKKIDPKNPAIAGYQNEIRVLRAQMPQNAK